MIPQGLSTFVLLVAIALRSIERRLIRDLEQAAAITPGGAIALVPGNPLGRWRLSRLEAGGAVRRTEAGRIFLDPDGWRAYRTARRKRVLLALGLLLPLLAMTYWWSRPR